MAYFLGWLIRMLPFIGFDQVRRVASFVSKQLIHSENMRQKHGFQRYKRRPLALQLPRNFHSIP